MEPSQESSVVEDSESPSYKQGSATADPITAFAAIGLAGNVAQFVEYALKVVSKGKEAYISIDGATEENSNIEQVTEELRMSIRNLSNRLLDCNVHFDDRIAEKEDVGLFAIAQLCEKLAGNIIEKLDNFKVEPGKFRRLRSLGQAVKAAWKKDEVDQLENTLSSYQRQLDTRIIVSFRTRFDKLDYQSAHRYKVLYQSAKNTLDTLKSFQSHQELVELKLQEPQETILHTAARKDDVKAMRQALTASPIEIDTHNADGQTALHIAASIGNLKVTKYLCQRGACLSSEDMHGRTPLHYAAIHNHAQITRALLSVGAKDFQEDDDGKLCIDYAKDALVEWLLSFGTDLEVRDPKTGYTALMHCSAENHGDSVLTLFDDGADLEAHDEAGSTALMLASMRGNTFIVSVLCSQCAKIDAQNDNGETALFLAAIGGHSDIVEALLIYKANIRHRNITDSHTAFVGAVLNFNWNIANLLLNAGSSLETLDKHGCSPLGLCARSGDYTAVEWLVHAASRGLGMILQFLIISGACTETRDHIGSTALQIADAEGQIDSVNALLSAGANMNTINIQGWSPLAETCSRGHVEITKVFLGKGVYVDTRDAHSYTPLHRAFMDNRYECARLLLLQGANRCPQNKDRWSPPTEAVVHGRIDMVKLLLDFGTKLETKNSSGYTALCKAVTGGHLNLVQLLLDYGAYSSPQNANGWSALAEAVVRGRTDITKVLLDHGAGLETKDDGGYTALCRAAQSGHLDCVQLLLERGAKTSAQNNHDWTALAEACRLQHMEIAQMLLVHNADPDIAGCEFHFPEQLGWTPLMRAASGGNLQIVKIMVDAGANVHAKTSRGQTSSMVPNESGMKHVFSYLRDLERTSSSG
ncbi:hypothetical protein MMC18_008456 [Xylographa bjoerkii]|nr:hypothetical protein [Xylographa bjoerkii]